MLTQYCDGVVGPRIADCDRAGALTETPLPAESRGLMPEAVKTVGRHEILRELGHGGMATVHLLCQRDLDRLVALKEPGAFHADPCPRRGSCASRVQPVRSATRTS